MLAAVARCLTPGCRACATDSELQSFTGKALLPGFGDDDDQEEQIAATVREVSGLFKDCERRLKEMGQSSNQGGADEVRE